MTYPNLHTAVHSLSRKLYTFAGHQIDGCMHSFCFDLMARGIDYINAEPSAKSVSFDGTIYVDGEALSVLVTLEGNSIFHPVNVTIQMVHSEE